MKSIWKTKKVEMLNCCAVLSHPAARTANKPAKWYLENWPKCSVCGSLIGFPTKDFPLPGGYYWVGHPADEKESRIFCEDCLHKFTEEKKGAR